MFTGLIEEVGQIKDIKKGEKSSKITVEANKVLQDVKLGDSISTNGVCLTVVEFSNNSFTVDVMPETILRSNLKYLSKGKKVNLERALRLGDRLGGHIVSGHIDGTGNIVDIKKDENATVITIKANSSIMKYIIEKGSIAVDGISLTVAYVDLDKFKVSIIPHTKDETTLMDMNIGETVNLECDMFGKYVERLSLFRTTESSESKIDMSFLKDNGFL